MWLWTSSLASLSLSFSFVKWNNNRISNRFIVRIKGISNTSPAKECVTRGKCSVQLSLSGTFPLCGWQPWLGRTSEIVFSSLRPCTDPRKDSDCPLFMLTASTTRQSEAGLSRPSSSTCSCEEIWNEQKRTRCHQRETTASSVGNHDVTSGKPSCLAHALQVLSV